MSSDSVAGPVEAARMPQLEPGRNSNVLSAFLDSFPRFRSPTALAPLEWQWSLASGLSLPFLCLCRGVLCTGLPLTSVQVISWSYFTLPTASFPSRLPSVLGQKGRHGLLMSESVITVWTPPAFDGFSRDQTCRAAFSGLPVYPWPVGRSNCC